MSASVAMDRLRTADPVLATVIDQVGRCRFKAKREGSHFESLCRAIVFQQLSTRAATTIHRRLAALFDGGSPDPARLLAIPDGDLRGAGLSRQKVAYLRDLASRTEAGSLPVDDLDEMDDDAVIEALTRVKGVGRWTAHMFLLFHLGRPDVLADGDLGIRKAIQRAYGLRRLPDEKRVRTIGARWAPHRSIACWYLWRYLDNGVWA